MTTSDAPARNFFVFDGHHWREFATLEAATEEADATIEHARDACDPEWPVWVTEICVFSAPPGCDDPEEDGRLVLYARRWVSSTTPTRRPLASITGATM